MSEDYPRRLRDHLAASRREGLGFDAAWDRAMRQVRRPKPGRAHDKWPLDWMRTTFREGFLRHAVMGPDATVLVEEPRLHREATVRVPLVVRDYCHSGDKCARDPQPGARFCPGHLAELHRIRDMVQSETRRPNGKAA